MELSRVVRDQFPPIVTIVAMVEEVAHGGACAGVIVFRVRYHRLREV